MAVSTMVNGWEESAMEKASSLGVQAPSTEESSNKTNETGKENSLI